MQHHELVRFANDLATILEFSPTARDYDLHVDVVVNCRAGGLWPRSHYRQRRRQLDGFLAGLVGRRSTITRSVYVTEYRGHARSIARRILLAAGQPGRLHFVISVGGDGTHSELLSTFAWASEGIRRRLWLHRMPLGTGNDGADATGFIESCTVLARSGTHHRIAALRIAPVGLEPMHAFNVASWGVDAFITDISNHLKVLCPGNIYRPVADVSTLLYEPIHGVDPLGLTYRDARGTRRRMRRRFMLVALGVSGHRTYGEGMPILPDHRNLCAIPRLSIMRKLAMKQKVFRGQHLGESEVLSDRVDRLELDYARTLPMQIDGEVVWLHPEHFPLQVELVKGLLPVMSAPPIPAGQLSRSLQPEWPGAMVSPENRRSAIASRSAFRGV